MSVQTQIKSEMHKRLEAMSAARVQWEEGTLRASNDELYAILEGVYALYAELKAEVGKRRAFAALLTDLDIKAQANSSLALKVIRYVFGTQGRREVAYSSVIAIAHDMKDADQSFTSYVQECGASKKCAACPSLQKQHRCPRMITRSLPWKVCKKSKLASPPLICPASFSQTQITKKTMPSRWYVAMTMGRARLSMAVMKRGSLGNLPIFNGVHP